MIKTDPRLFTTSRAMLRLLLVLNLCLGAGISGLLLSSLLAEKWTMAALGAAVDLNPKLLPGMRAIMLIGLCSVPFAHVIFSRLLAIVDTARAGDPFSTDNSERLKSIAWALVGLEVLHILAGLVAAAASTEAAPLDIDWNISVAGWLAVLLLFVLARVFEQGARMHKDLEGTV